MSVSNTQRNYFKGTTLRCEVLAKWHEELSSFPVLSSPPSSPLPFSSCLACQKTAATKKPLQAKLLPFTLPWIRTTGEAFTIPSLEAACTHQMKALGTEGALEWREEMVRAREAAWGSALARRLWNLTVWDSKPWSAYVTLGKLQTVSCLSLLHCKHAMIMLSGISYGLLKIKLYLF